MLVSMWNRVHDFCFSLFVLAKRVVPYIFLLYFTRVRHYKDSYTHAHTHNHDIITRWERHGTEKKYQSIPLLKPIEKRGSVSKKKCFQKKKHASMNDETDIPRSNPKCVTHRNKTRRLYILCLCKNTKDPPPFVCFCQNYKRRRVWLLYMYIC
mmetsp:Transcript_52310/g.78053  ORF Transcript_52310/g.78053 Transcript_52310/m.78053 type:complete len:153 (+) Transcript_52310:597-1055(+)